MPFPAQLGAILPIAVPPGAMHRELFVWKTGFRGEDGAGRYCHARYLVACRPILTTGRGRGTPT